MLACSDVGKQLASLDGHEVTLRMCKNGNAHHHAIQPCPPGPCPRPNSVYINDAQPIAMAMDSKGNNYSLRIHKNPKIGIREHVFCRREKNRTKYRRMAKKESKRNFSTLHETNKSEELLEEVDGNSTTQLSGSRDATCEIHDSQFLALYCETCAKVVCRDCVILSCSTKNHKYGFIGDIMTRHKSILDRELQPVKESHQELSNALQVISVEDSELLNEKDAQLSRVDATFDAFMDIIAEERVHLKEAIVRSFQERMDHNFSRKSEISKTLLESTSLVLALEAASLNESVEEYVTGMDHKINSIKDMKNMIEKVTTVLIQSVKKVPEMEINLLAPSVFKDFHQLKNFMHRKDDPLKCHLESPALLSSIIPLRKPFEVILYIDPQKVGRTIFGWTKNVLETELHCRYDSSTQKVDLMQVTPEKYLLTLKPQKRGKHVLNIKHNNAHVCNSPIPVYVTAEPGELTNPKVQPLQNPAGVKFYDGKIYVSLVEEGILVLGAPNMNLIGELKVNGVNEVLVDTHHIYATDIHQHRLIKMNHNGLIVSTTGSKGKDWGLFDNPKGIKFSREREIYVCDSSNHRIQVFNQNLDFLRIFGGKGENNGCFNFPHDLDFDDDGNMYVVDQGNHRIQVLTPEGGFLHTIAGRAQEKLDNPVSIAINRGLLYVTDSENRRISVFSTVGNFIASFGGDILTNPECITIDDNGYIYVTDGRSKLIRF